jgi:hypothetical protein
MDSLIDICTNRRLYNPVSFWQKNGLLGVIGLEAIFIVLNSAFLILTLGQIAEAGMHDPLANWWVTLLRYLFSIMTLIFSIKAYREIKKGKFNV